MIRIILIFWFLTAVFIYDRHKLKKNSNYDKNKFEDSFFQGIYALSFSVLFKWFVADDDQPEDERAERLKRNLILAEWTHLFSLRSYMAFKLIIVFLGLICFAATLLIADNWHFMSEFLFGIQTDPYQVTFKTKLLVLSLFLIVSLAPDFFLKRQVKKKLNENSKDIPVLQMFITLMLRSGKTLTEIFYALSKVDTAHKGAFKKGHRIYVRNQKEGFLFFKNHFKETSFAETFYLLEDLSKYEREKCVQLLEDNLKTLIDEREMVHKRRSMSRLAYSQGSMALPFTAILLLIALPLIALGLTFFTEAFDYLM